MLPIGIFAQGLEIMALTIWNYEAVYHVEVQALLRETAIQATMGEKMKDRLGL